MVNVQENLPYLPQGAKLFDGASYREIMPVLREAGLVAISPAQVFDMRNQHAGSEHRDAVWGTYWDTGAAVARTKKEVVLELDSQLLAAVTTKTRLTRGGIALPEGHSGTGVKRYQMNDLRPFLNKPLAEKVLRDDTPIRRVYSDLMEGDETRLDDTITNTFKLGKDVYGYNEMMGFWVADDGVVRALVLGDLGVRARADGGNHDLDGDLARLVGVRRSVASEASAESESAAGGAAPVSTGNEVVSYRAVDIARVEALLDLAQPAQGLEQRLQEALTLLRARKST